LATSFRRRLPRAKMGANLYLVLCVLGFVIPYDAFIPWLLEHGLNLRLFAQDLLANRITIFFALDVIVSAIVLVVFIGRERHPKIRGI
jgi:hypothetical protein